MTLKTLRKIKMDIVTLPKLGEIVEGKILARDRSSLFLDLGPKGIGVIYGREFFGAKDILKNLKEGMPLFAKVTALETEDGYRELSLTEASHDLAWREVAKAKETGEVFEVQIRSANKGGLVAEVKGIPAFLPTSQLVPEHYPKVQGAEPAKIAQELQKFLGKKLKVKILDVNSREKKLILSERASKKEKVEEELKNYKVGDVVEGEISGITNFGAFLRFGKRLEGLINASEMSKAEDKEVKDVLKLGDKKKAEVIEITDSRLYLKILPKS